MQSIKLKSHIGSDGILHLDLPVGIKDKELEVMVIFQAVDSFSAIQTPESLGWPPNFFEQTAGCLQDDFLGRYPQRDCEERESSE